MDHPINGQIKKQIEVIELGRQKPITGQRERWFCAFNGVKRAVAPQPHAQPVYVLDVNKNIIARLEAKHLVKDWIRKEFGSKVTGQTTYRYFSSGKLYKNKYYFVPVDQYEKFMENN
ncbi:hypothetical protein [Bacillus cereus group sp. BcHK114]|uniref:hypothetical protein n=1 Tax=Bacillus cereus group sp. BcHK114 TaxID=3018095 RepID=UPI0022E01509|nr:hypothetical protein [Bacillus cereus group sp. BcHK114]MDA1958184.1 hypothetical protein [Bacillus cereus group sp. BcHK114]